MKMENNMDKIDELMEIAMSRFEDAGIGVSQKKRDALYWSIRGELERNGYEAAYTYVTATPLSK